MIEFLIGCILFFVVVGLAIHFWRVTASILGLAVVIGVINSINSYNAAQHEAAEAATRSEIAELHQREACAKPSHDGFSEELMALEREFLGCPANSSHTPAAVVRR